VKPESIIFVDETGCNTKQKTDEHIRGQFFVFSSDSTESGVMSSCTNIHFSVVCFNNAEVKPILC
jgi:vancomycin resistance protein YoaR